MTLFSALRSRLRLLVLGGAVVLFGLATAHTLHARADTCSICDCDDNPFSALYHPDVCDPLPLWPHRCYATDFHHCDNYPEP